MAIKFNPVARINPGNLSAPKQYYAFLDKGDEVTFDELIDFTGKLSGINEPYIVAVMRTFEKVIIEQLSHGRYVHLGRIGTLYLSLLSEGVEKVEDLSAKNIKFIKIRFKPGKVLKNAALGYTLQKA